MSIVRDNRAFLAFSILILTVTAAGCTIQNNYLYYFYDLRIYGLDNFTTDNGSFQILVPVPAYNGTIVVTPDMLPEDVQIGPNSSQISAPGFDLHIVDSPYGKMYQGLATLDTNGSKMYRIADSRDIKGKDRVEGLKDMNLTSEGFIMAPITPLATNDTEARYTKWINGSNVKNFTTYIYIDESLKPIRDNASIELVLMFQIFPKNSTRTDLYFSKNQRRVSRWYEHATGQDTYFMCIHEVIPGNVTGYVPVKVQCIDNVTYDRFSSYYYPASIV